MQRTTYMEYLEDRLGLTQPYFRNREFLTMQLDKLEQLNKFLENHQFT